MFTFSSPTDGQLSLSIGQLERRSYERTEEPPWNADASTPARSPSTSPSASPSA